MPTDQIIGGSGGGACVGCGQYGSHCTCFKEPFLPVDPHSCAHPVHAVQDRICGKCGVDVVEQAHTREHIADRTTIRQLRTELAEVAADATTLLQALPKCEYFVKYHDARGGEESCDRIATKAVRGPERAAGLRRIHEDLCDECADGDPRKVTITDLPWAAAVRKILARAAAKPTEGETP